MKYRFSVIGLIANILFIWMPLNGAELPRTPSRTFVHERKTSLPNSGKLTNQLTHIILQLPKEQESQKIDLLRLLEWNAYQKNEKLDLQIYSNALSSLKQERFNYGDHPLGEAAIPPLLNPYFSASDIENNELKITISSILENKRKATIGNFNQRIKNYDKKIQIKLSRLQQQQHLESQIQPEINNLIAKQLKEIDTKAQFTQDKEELKNDIKKLSSYEGRIQGENLILLNQLKQRTQTELEIELPITELAPEEQSSSSTSTEEPREPEKESEVLPEKPISSSSSSSTSPVSSPPTSPRKQEITPNIVKIIAHETQEPKIVPEKHASSSTSSSSSTESFEELIQQDHTPEAPFQATEGEPPNGTKHDSNNTSSEEDEQSSSAENQPPTLPTAQPTPKVPVEPMGISEKAPTPPPTSSSFWDFSWLREKIAAFFHRIFWSIYGYR